MADQQQPDLLDHEKGRVEDEANSSHDEQPKSPVPGAPDATSSEDTQVQWTFARVIAIVSLCLVYVGVLPHSTTGYCSLLISL